MGSVLRIKDENGNFIGINAIRGPEGPEGKSAYEQAVESGYTGTEEEFMQILLNAAQNDLSNVEDSTVKEKIDSALSEQVIVLAGDMLNKGDVVVGFCEGDVVYESDRLTDMYIFGKAFPYTDDLPTEILYPTQLPFTIPYGIRVTQIEGRVDGGSLNSVSGLVVKHVNEVASKRDVNMYYKTTGSFDGTVSNPEYNPYGYYLNGGGYTVSIPGITELKAGVVARIITHESLFNMGSSTYLDVNDTGPKEIRRLVYVDNPDVGTTKTIHKRMTFRVGIPLDLVYDGTYWIAQNLTAPSANDLEGIVPPERGGTGVSSLSALVNVIAPSIGAAKIVTASYTGNGIESKGVATGQLPRIVLLTKNANGSELYIAMRTPLGGTVGWSIGTEGVQQSVDKIRLSESGFTVYGLNEDGATYYYTLIG